MEDVFDFSKRRYCLPKDSFIIFDISKWPDSNKAPLLPPQIIDDQGKINNEAEQIAALHQSIQQPEGSTETTQISYDTNSASIKEYKTKDMLLDKAQNHQQRVSSSPTSIIPSSLSPSTASSASTAPVNLTNVAQEAQSARRTSSFPSGSTITATERSIYNGSSVSGSTYDHGTYPNEFAFTRSSGIPDGNREVNSNEDHVLANSDFAFDNPASSSRDSTEPSRYSPDDVQLLLRLGNAELSNVNSTNATAVRSTIEFPSAAAPERRNNNNVASASNDENRTSTTSDAPTSPVLYSLEPVVSTHNPSYPGPLSMPQPVPSLPPQITHPAYWAQYQQIPSKQESLPQTTAIAPTVPTTIVQPSQQLSQPPLLEPQRSLVPIQTAPSNEVPPPTTLMVDIQEPLSNVIFNSRDIFLIISDGMLKIFPQPCQTCRGEDRLFTPISKQVGVYTANEGSSTQERQIIRIEPLNKLLTGHKGMITANLKRPSFATDDANTSTAKTRKCFTLTSTTSTPVKTTTTTLPTS
ncbi:Oidioi.mRNA.OKI2018_I69.PAR.g12698.t1.cds [Oikopleura dioica]|uniref:Oidioi.mRNA.OKI2018_I69.PAR.g12698.t1.cds n=1 Tax=Oikopleura dioica TaxID=34765 RepID=A0ABN7S1U2_OIKDI|nr:Oidioi.mRNA.OKI2018_I69.PAR.g12698.t1.cds [Oikopleura dioica]